MNMSDKEYARIFNSFLDNNLLNSGILLNGYYLKENQKLEILEYLSLRLQIEFGKKVILLLSKEIETELDMYTRDSIPSSVIPNNSKLNPVYLCMFTKCSYFTDKGWEENSLNHLLYYKQPFFGFTNGKQEFVLYEN